MGPRSLSFRVLWFLSVFVGFLGSATGKNHNAGLLMCSSQAERYVILYLLTADLHAYANFKAGWKLNKCSRGC